MQPGKIYRNIFLSLLYKERFDCAFFANNFGINWQNFYGIVAITSVEAPQMLHALNSFHHCKIGIKKFVMKTGCGPVRKCVQIKTCRVLTSSRIPARILCLTIGLTVVRYVPLNLCDFMCHDR